MLACAAFFMAACERVEQGNFMAEVDEQGFRRGKELIRQGRNQEALTEFQKVIEKRGLNNAPESHLELGLLYQYHIRDPIAAIYHYRRFRELKPTSPQADLVRQRIDAATREFAGTLPGDPMSNLEKYDMTDVVQQLQRENEQLKTELARARAAVVPRPTRRDALPLEESENVVETNGPAHLAQNDSPLVSPDQGPVETAPALPPPTRSGILNPPTPATSQATSTPPRTVQPPPSSGRKHVIVKGDTIMSLAQKYYGNRSRWRDILEANRDQLRSQDDPLRIGMELKIP